PLISAKFNDAGDLFSRLRFRRGSGRLLLVVGLLLALRFLLGGRLIGVVLVLALLFFGFLREVAFAHAFAIADPKHDDTVTCFLLSKRVARNALPVEIALLFVADQPRMKLALANDRDFR